MRNSFAQLDEPLFVSVIITLKNKKSLLELQTKRDYKCQQL